MSSTAMVMQCNNRLLFWTAFLWVCSVPLVEAQERRIIRGGDFTKSITITSPQSIVEIIGATFTGDIAIVLDVGAMVSNRRPVWITVYQSRFVNMASLYISGSNVIVDDRMPVYLTIDNTTFFDGGLAIRGCFPPASRIVLANSDIIVNTAVARLPLWSIFTSRLGSTAACWMALQDVSLRKQSSLLFSGCRFSGNFARSNSANAIFYFMFLGSFSIYDQSALWFRNATTVARSFFIHFHGSLIADKSSAFVLEDMTIQCDHICVSFEQGVFQFTDRSAFVVSRVEAFVPIGESGSDVFLFQNVVASFTDGSAFMMRDNDFYQVVRVMVLFGSSLTISGSSSRASFFANKLRGAKWNVAIGVASGGIAFAQCNTLDGVELSTFAQYEAVRISGLTGVSPCPQPPACQFRNSSCFVPNSVDVTSSCECQCANARGPWCLDTIRPLYLPYQETASVTSELSVDSSVTQTASSTYDLSTTMTTSNVESYSVSNISSRSHTISVTLHASMSQSMSASMSMSESKSVSMNASMSLGMSVSLSMSLSDSVTASATLSASVTESNTLPTRILSLTPSESTQATLTQTISICANVTGASLWDGFELFGLNMTSITQVDRMGSDGHTFAVVIFVMPKFDALRIGDVVISLALSRQLQLAMQHVGKRVATGTNGIVVNATNATALQVRVAPRGSQYIGTTASVEIPLSVLAGTCVWGRRSVRVEVILTATVIDALEAAQAVSVVTGPVSVFVATPATAIAVTRLNILIDILECQIDDTSRESGNNLLGLRIGPRHGAAMRGAVVGNLLLVAMCVALAAALVFGFVLYGCFVHGAPVAALTSRLEEIFHVPGVLMLPIAGVCQPTLAACVQLIALAPVDGDRVFGLIGAAVVVLLLILPMSITVSKQFCLRLVEMRPRSVGAVPEGSALNHDVDTTTRSAYIRTTLKRVGHVMFVERATWVPVVSTPRCISWKKRFVPIYVDCGKWWYPIADMWMAAAVGVVGGLTLGNSDVCYLQLGVMAITYCLSAFLQLLVSVPLVLASKCYTVTLQALGAIGCLMLLIEIIVEGQTVALTIATVCMLSIALLSTIKSCADIAALALAAPGRFRKALTAVTQHLMVAPDDDSPAMPLLAAIVANEEMAEPTPFLVGLDDECVLTRETTFDDEHDGDDDIFQAMKRRQHSADHEEVLEALAMNEANELQLQYAMLELEMKTYTSELGDGEIKP